MLINFAKIKGFFRTCNVIGISVKVNKVLIKAQQIKASPELDTTYTTMVTFIGTIPVMLNNSKMQRVVARIIRSSITY